jgi:hypothetical protein
VALPGRFEHGTDPESLCKWLAEWEAETGGRALAIPHNGNMSNGWMFREARQTVERRVGQRARTLEGAVRDLPVQGQR